jgi:hypothetical protein
MVGLSPLTVHVEPAGKFAYVHSGGGISAFSINPDTGALAPIAGSPFAGGGFALWFYGTP